MHVNKLISELTGVVTYRCECQHPTREETSVLYIDDKATADAYRQLGRTVTPLARYIDPNTQIEEAFSDTEMRIEAAVATSREGIHEVHCSMEDGNPFGTDADGSGKPFCRIEWYADGGDPTVGIQASYGWVLAADQAGTLLEEQAMMQQPVGKAVSEHRGDARFEWLRERFAQMKTSASQNMLDAARCGSPAVIWPPAGTWEHDCLKSTAKVLIQVGQACGNCRATDGVAPASSVASGTRNGETK